MPDQLMVTKPSSQVFETGQCSSGAGGTPKSSPGRAAWGEGQGTGENLKTGKVDSWKKAMRVDELIAKFRRWC